VSVSPERCIGVVRNDFPLICGAVQPLKGITLSFRVFDIVFESAIMAGRDVVDTKNNIRRLMTTWDEVVENPRE
jgi:hypothetical protein